MARSSRWYTDQRKVAFAVISTFVVLLITAFTFLGVNPELKAFITRPVSGLPTNRPIGNRGCVVSGKRLLEEHYSGLFFTHANSQDGKVTFKNNHTDNCSGLFVLAIRVAAGGDIVFNQNAKMWQIMEVLVPPNSEKTVVASLPQGCDAEKDVLTGPLVRPIQDNLDFSKYNVVASVALNGPGHPCPPVVSPYIGRIGSAFMPNARGEGVVTNENIVKTYGIAPTQAKANENAINALATKCMATTTDNLYQIFKGIFLRETGGVNPDPIVTRWLGVAPQGAPFNGFCTQDVICRLDQTVQPILEGGGQLGTIPIQGKQIPIFGAIAVGACDIQPLPLY